MTARGLAASTLGAVGAAFVVFATSGAARADDASTSTSTNANAPAAATSAAQERYTAGRESYRLGLYGRALEEFERSLALLPSPNTRLYIARALRELGRWAEASEQYAATVREADQRGGRYVATRDAAAVELADVKVRLERANASDSATPLPLGPPGPATSAAAPPPPQTTGATGATAATDAEPASPHRGSSALTWVSGSIAVAGAASFAVFYGLAGSRFGYLEDNCARVRTSSCDDARTSGKTDEVVAYTALGVAVVAGAVAIYSLVRAPEKTGPAAAQPAQRKVSWPLAF
jgi:tetratricopeptide (TPR) repeat protein